MRFRLEIGLLLLAMISMTIAVPISSAYPICDCNDPKCSGNLNYCPYDDCECYHCVCSCRLLKTKCGGGQCGSLPNRGCPKVRTVDVLVVTDEEYRNWCNQNGFNYFQRVIDNIEYYAAQLFLDEHGIDLHVKHSIHTFVSDTNNYIDLLAEVQNDLNWPVTDWGCDILVLYTAVFLGGVAEGAGGDRSINDDTAIVPYKTDIWARTGYPRHEIGHLFDAANWTKYDSDHQNDGGSVTCVMDPDDLEAIPPPPHRPHITYYCKGCSKLIDANIDHVMNLHENR